MRLEIKEIGMFVLKPSNRNKRVVVRCVGDYFTVSYPSLMSKEALTKTLKSMQSGILDFQKKNLKDSQLKPLPDLCIEPVTLTFSVEIVRNTLGENYFTFANNVLRFSFDKTYKISAPENIQKIENLFEQICRKEAKAYFSREVEKLAKLHGFKYNTIKINKAKSRWGSCSFSGNINITMFAMRLPQHLVHYLILHELCHTVHFNHSDDFWALMNKVTNNKAMELRKELRENYSTNWSGYSLSKEIKS